jgi:dihydroxy-acid dehydratase
VVFDDIDDFKARIDDPALDVDANSVLVLRNCGPKGYPGMAEVGNMALPKKLLAQGVRDMVRISDARMSGTAYGTVVLHVAPEATEGGPLALVQSGDEILLDVAGRRLELLISPAELAARAAARSPKPRTYRGGYETMYVTHVQGADVGADLDFLVGRRGADVPRESH